MDVRPLDALVVVSFGGPERPEDVVPFLQNVTRGKAIPPERLAEVGEHYSLFGGKSPINDLNREFVDALRTELTARDVDLPVYWGNRNWDPYLRDAFRQMQADGVRTAAYFVTSAYSSYSGCRQYREDLFEANRGIGMELVRLRQFFNHPGFIASFVETTERALDGLPGATPVVFVAHSVPTEMNDMSGGPMQRAYEKQHLVAAQLVARRVGVERWSLAYCSRSGPPHMPWLEPDINDRLRSLAAEGHQAVAVVPIGFVADHMEVIFDLDTEAASTAERLGLEFRRADTPGTHAAYVEMVLELLEERAAALRGESVTPLKIGDTAANPNLCPTDCCPNPRTALPAVP